MNPEEELRKKSSAARKIRREQLKAKDPAGTAQKLNNRRRREAESRAELKANNPEAADEILKARRRREAELKVMATSLMAVRSLDLGGIHMHKLFALEVGTLSNAREISSRW